MRHLNLDAEIIGIFHHAAKSGGGQILAGAAEDIIREEGNERRKCLVTALIFLQVLKHWHGAAPMNGFHLAIEVPSKMVL